MTKGEVCPGEAGSALTGLSKAIRQSKTQLAGWKYCSCFQDRADSAIIGAEFGRHLGNVGWYSSPAYQALVPLRDEAAEMTLIAYSVPA